MTYSVPPDRATAAAQRINRIARSLRHKDEDRTMDQLRADVYLDHRTTWADGGPTTKDNLGPLCRHDHCIRHQHGWTYTPLPNGTHQWTSRLGHAYTTSGTPP